MDEREELLHCALTEIAKHIEYQDELSDKCQLSLLLGEIANIDLFDFDECSNALKKVLGLFVDLEINSVKPVYCFYRLVNLNAPEEE